MELRESSRVQESMVSAADLQVDLCAPQMGLTGEGYLKRRREGKAPQMGLTGEGYLKRRREGKGKECRCRGCIF
ncbi:hypothetical protein AAC387_Pa08g2262 [Persea americana]